MRISAIVAISCVFALVPWARGIANAGNASLVGFAFVGPAVTSQGSKAKLPAGAEICPPGSTVTGITGCRKLLVAIIDYQGPPSAGSVAVTRHPATGGAFPEDAPYYMDLNAGRMLQELGGISVNGSYDVRFSYNYAEGQQRTTRTRLILKRECQRGS